MWSNLVSICLLAITGLMSLLHLTSSNAITKQPQTPILVYHHIENHAGRWNITPQTFERELNYLQRNGYHPATMAEYSTALKQDQSLPDHVVILTFDDGYEDMYTQAFPLLKKYGMTGTFYIITGKVGTTGYLTWAQISEMAQAGMEFGGHTVDHVMLTQIPITTALWEIAQSRADLETHLHQDITTFAYPFNDHNASVIAMTAEAGYSTGVIVDWHTGDQQFSPYRIARITIDGGESMDVFKLVLLRGYEPLPTHNHVNPHL